MDIDQIITNNVDDILTFPVSGNTIGTYRSWWISKLNSDKSINTSYIIITFHSMVGSINSNLVS